MTWYEAILLTIAVIFAIFVVFVAPFIAAGAIDKLIEKCRRKKHPEYFEYWDEGKKLSFERGKEFNRRKEYFDFKFKLYNLGLRNGECTNEYYTKKMNELMIEYQELCARFQEEEANIRELLDKADLYAKEHNLYWGIIYK